MTGAGRRSGTVAAALALLLAAGAALAQAVSITPNYRETDIRQIIEAVGDITGKTFIVDPRINAKVTMLSNQAMSADAFYEAFLSVLDVYGFIAVDAGDVVKILPNANARQLPGAESANGSPNRDDVLTQVIEVKNIGAAQLVPILRPLIPQYGHLAAHAPSNMLIISDRAANVRRLLSIIRRIDQAGDEDIEVVTLEHASATEIVRVLTALNQGQRADAGGGQPSSLVADERTNSVLIGGERNARVRLRALIAHLDTPLEDGGNTQVRYLRYANAPELAEKLAAQQQLQQTAAAGQTAAPGGPNAAVNIWSDEQTNALIMTAPPKVMRSLMMVVDKLDIRRAQVLVEAIIVEITADKAAELGVSWAIDGSEDNNAIGVTNFPDFGPGVVQLGSAVAGDSTAGLAGLIGTGVTFGVGKISDNGTSFAAIARALDSDADTNIISTPTIVTMDNEEASIEVGQEVPFLTGSFTGVGNQGGDLVNPFQTINREQIGTLLEITPQINEGDAILMKIRQETSSISQQAGAVDLITNERAIETSVIVEDGGILVLGGLIDDTLRERDQRVPVLGHIPLLGNLFRTRTTSKVKTNLMVFIHPRILRDGTQTAIETNAKYNYVRDLQLGEQGEKIRLMRDAQRPLLPPIDAYRQAQPGEPPPIDLRELPPDTEERSDSGDEDDGGDP